MLGAALALLALTAALTTVTDAPLTVLVWSDEFSGARGAAPDPATWVAQTGGAGWGNAELECYTDQRANSSLDGRGHLLLVARAAPGHACGGGVNDYTSARLMTRAPVTLTEGTIAIRAQLPAGAGVWPALWALGADQPAVGWPRCGEIDLAEVAGARPTLVHTSLHGPDATGAPFTVTGVHDVGAAVDEGFHTYSVTWTPGDVTFRIDGQVVFTASRATVEARGRWVFAQPFRVLLDVAVGGSFGGPPTPGTPWPRTMVLDYVRVYS